jgi:anti-anti-sigma regulatory factor
LSITESTPTPGLSVSVVGSEGDALVCLSGRLSIDSSPGVRDQLLAILDQESLPTLTIDLAEVTYIDASGIAAGGGTQDRSRPQERIAAEGVARPPALFA